MGYGEVFSLPITTFWELSRNVDRIKAEDDLRQQRLLANIIGGDPSKLANELVKERGEIASTDDPATGFDRSGLNELKALLGRGKR